MSITVATVADALIEFILSLLRDPEAVEEFEADPAAALGSRGLSQVRAEDVCAVAPVIAERPAVVVAADPNPDPPSPSVNPVVREIQNIVNNLTIDDRDTIVDQSVNQNIWAAGDVTQTFDNEAVVGSGDGSIAAGDDVDIDQTEDNSTNVNAGENVNMGNDTTTTVTAGSNNQQTDTSTTTDSSTATTTTGSGNDSSTTTTAESSYNDSATTYQETAVDTESTTVYESTDTVIDETGSDDF
ncbi:MULTISPECIES: IniB N-terminal domain-containing protein [unclassified Microbacterium]|uniref:IniB N-terminal domain-containing protein n=1 Tax=unclassified Microbacterium TaxID=2609290 RepID=UPI00214B893B|nr:MULTISPECIES: IniB N-terminal domain-containing protein [unclassified Microbacterium]MCR2785029.1 IniB N-terminal domain-containing protein [Microbacterium sp. zg.B96]WIM16567.1 IniB N-terminal domain-containing protein [Microbacterium sp. zg-B96]